MSIENILNTIDKEALSNADRIIGKAEAEADKIRKEYADRANELNVRLQKVSEKKADEVYRRMIVNEQLELRKTLLSEKHKILDAFYKEARKKIKEMPPEKYLKFVKRLILNRAISGSEEIIVSAKQKKIFTGDFLESLNQSFPGGGHFTLSDSGADFAWGVVLKEKRRIVDLSFDVLFEQVTERVESQVAALLFPEDK
jgi:V/A-type H+-transporting ATPase subunit E